MYGYYRLFPRWTSYLGISLIGALASNLVQVWLSLGFIFGASAWVIVPYFLGMGGATGIVMGFFAQIFVKKSRWFSFLLDEFPVLPPGLPGKSVSNGIASSDSIPVTPTPFEMSTSKKRPAKNRQRRKQWIMSHGNPTYLFALGLGALVLFAFQSRLDYRALQVVILYLLAEATGKHVRLGYFLILFLSVTFFGLLQPAGQVLYQLGPLTITQGALAQGAFRALTLIGFVFGSLAFVQPHLQLPGWTGRMIGGIFRYYEGLNHFRGHLRGKGFIQTLDRLLFSVFSPGEPVELPQNSKKWEGKNHPGVLLVSIGVLLVFLYLLWKVG
jgi:heptaprenyl diphosphate synthase